MNVGPFINNAGHTQAPFRIDSDAEVKYHDAIPDRLR